MNMSLHDDIFEKMSTKIAKLKSWFLSLDKEIVLG